MVNYHSLWLDAEEEIKELKRRHINDLLEKDKRNDECRLKMVGLLQLIDEGVNSNIDLPALNLAANWIVYNRIV